MASFALVAVICLLQIVPTLQMIWGRPYNIPLSDEWSNIPLIEQAKNGTLGLDDLWAYRSTHRVVVVRVLSLPLILLTDWNRQVLMTLNVLVTLLTLIVAHFCLKRTFGATIGAMVLVPVAALLFSLGHVDTWLHPYHLGFHTGALGAMLGTLGLLLPVSGVAGLIVAIGGAVLASLSLLSGLLMWPAFVPAVAITGLRRTLIWIMAAVAVIVPYAAGFPTGEAADRNPQLLPSLAYVPVYLGAPFVNDVWGATWFTIGGIFLSAINLVVYLRRGGRLAPVMPWSGLAAFILGNAIVTAIGRGSNTEQALATRYQPLSVIWWVVVVVIAALAIRQVWITTPDRVFTPAQPSAALLGGLNALALLVGCGALVATGIAEYRKSDDWLEVRWRNRACLLEFAYATDECYRIYAGDGMLAFARDSTPFLEQEGLAIFSDHPSFAIAALPVSAATADAQITNVMAGETRDAATSSSGADKDKNKQRRRDDLVIANGTALEVSGWARDPVTGGAVGGVIVEVDGVPTVWATYGLPVRGGPDPGKSDEFSGFSAMIPAAALAPGEHELILLVISPDLATRYAQDAVVRASIGVRDR